MAFIAWPGYGNIPIVFSLAVKHKLFVKVKGRGVKPVSGGFSRPHIVPKQRVLTTRVSSVTLRATTIYKATSPCFRESGAARNLHVAPKHSCGHPVISVMGSWQLLQGRAFG